MQNDLVDKDVIRDVIGATVPVDSKAFQLVVDLATLCGLHSCIDVLTRVAPAAKHDQQIFIISHGGTISRSCWAPFVVEARIEPSTIQPLPTKQSCPHERLWVSLRSSLSNVKERTSKEDAVALVFSEELLPFLEYLPIPSSMWPQRPRLCWSLQNAQFPFPDGKTSTSLPYYFPISQWINKKKLNILSHLRRTHVDGKGDCIGLWIGWRRVFVVERHPHATHWAFVGQAEL
jgi:hypothetical protein